MFGDFQMKFVEEEVYLGDVISAQGLETSVERTIEKQMSKIKGAMYEAYASGGRHGWCLGSVGYRIIQFLKVMYLVLTLQVHHTSPSVICETDSVFLRADTYE